MNINNAINNLHLFRHPFLDQLTKGNLARKFTNVCFNTKS